MIIITNYNQTILPISKYHFFFFNPTVSEYHFIFIVTSYCIHFYYCPNN